MECSVKTISSGSILFFHIQFNNINWYEILLSALCFIVGVLTVVQSTGVVGCYRSHRPEERNKRTGLNLFCWAAPYSGEVNDTIFPIYKSRFKPGSLKVSTSSKIFPCVQFLVNRHDLVPVTLFSTPLEPSFRSILLLVTQTCYNGREQFPPHGILSSSLEGCEKAASVLPSWPPSHRRSPTPPTLLGVPIGGELVLAQPGKDLAAPTSASPCETSRTLLLVGVDAGAKCVDMTELPLEAVPERACLAVAHGRRAEATPYRDVHGNRSFFPAYAKDARRREKKKDAHQQLPVPQLLSNVIML